MQGLRGTTLSAAKRTFTRINCHVRKVGDGYSKLIKRDRVIPEKPGFGAILQKSGKVNLVVSRGRKH